MSTRGERLQLAMVERQVRKQQALAFQLGVHESAITRWKEDGSLSLTNAIALCKALDISLDWLLLGRGTIDTHKIMSEPPYTEHSQLISSFNELSHQMTGRTRALLQSFIMALHTDLLETAPRIGL